MSKWLEKGLTEGGPVRVDVMKGVPPLDSALPCYFPSVYLSGSPLPEQVYRLANGTKHCFIGVTVGAGTRKFWDASRWAS